jgi:hypothetical protein
MGRARNNIAAVAGVQAQGRRQDLFAAVMGTTRGAQRSGDLALGSERIRQLGFDVPGLEREAEDFAYKINGQTLDQRGQVNILKGVPYFTVRDVAPFASILLKNRTACAALSIPRITFDPDTMLTAFINLIVNAGSDRPWDMASDGSFILKTLLWWHAETVDAADGGEDPAFDISAEVDAMKALYERLREHFRLPDKSRSQSLWTGDAAASVTSLAAPTAQP